MEKIAVAYWRFRRACRYEVGLIRQELDTATDDYYSETKWHGERVNKTDGEIEHEIGEEREAIREWENDKKNLRRMHQEGRSLEEIYDWEANWSWLADKVSDLLEEDFEEGIEPKELRESLNSKANWSDDRIWETHVRICDERIQHHRGRVVALRKEKEKNRLRLQVVKRLGNIPSKDELERLLRYEGAIERQFYKALNQLERAQRLRLGDNIPAPVEVDLNVNMG